MLCENCSRAGGAGPCHLSPRGQDGTRLWRRPPPARGRHRHHGHQPVDRLPVRRHDDHDRGGHDPVCPASDPGGPGSTRAARCTRTRAGDSGRDLCDQHQRPAAVCGAGRPRDQIIGVSFVTSEGVVVKGGGRVVKNVAGYDFPKLLTGSMGTLGIITQLTLKVRPDPRGIGGRVGAVPNGGSRCRCRSISSTRRRRARWRSICSIARGPRLAGQGLGLPAGDFVLAIGYEESATSVQLAARPVEDRAEIVRSHDRGR